MRLCRTHVEDSRRHTENADEKRYETLLEKSTCSQRRTASKYSCIASCRRPPSVFLGSLRLAVMAMLTLPAPGDKMMDRLD